MSLSDTTESDTATAVASAVAADALPLGTAVRSETPCSRGIGGDEAGCDATSELDDVAPLSVDPSWCSTLRYGALGRHGGEAGAPSVALRMRDVRSNSSSLLWQRATRRP